MAQLTHAAPHPANPAFLLHFDEAIDWCSCPAGILFGVTNAASSLSGTFSTYATGQVLDATHSWSMIFQIVAIVYAASSLVYTVWASTDRQFDDQPPVSDGRSIS
jgi:nitrate/nitrite transporter NarK